MLTQIRNNTNLDVKNNLYRPIWINLFYFEYLGLHHKSFIWSHFVATLFEYFNTFAKDLLWKKNGYMLEMEAYDL